MLRNGYEGNYILLTQFFQEVPPGRLLLIWANKLSYWCRTVEEAEALVPLAAEQRQDLYYGVALADEEMVDARAEEKGYDRKYIRTTNASAREVPGLWLDLDWKGGWGEEEASAFLHALLPPSVLVRTGHGHHGYWLFDRPRRIQADTCHGFQRWVQSQAPYHIDKTGDLARILRVPGTMNYKGDPVPVEVVYDDGPRYELGELPNQPASTSTWKATIRDGVIPNGARNESLTSILGYMRGHLTGEQLDSFAMWWNENVSETPEPERDVLRTSQSVRRY